MANNSWSDLPIPILNLITERLPYYDFVRSGAVCKTWQQAVLDAVQARRKNPSTWVMNHGCFNHDGEIFSILELSDPSTRQTYSVGDIITQEVRELFVDAKPCASRYGWLLLSKKVKVEDGSSTIFFFYNPFQNKVIELSSPLILNNKIARHKATFTASPTTNRDDCAIFVVSKRYNHVYVLSTYNLADRTWRTIYTTDRILPVDNVLEVKAKELAYMDGILFCTFHSKSSHTTLLGAFNVALEAWDMMDCSVFAKKIRCSGGNNCYSMSRYHYYLVEVPYSKVFLVAGQDCHDWHAFEYDGTGNKWFEVESFKKTFENRRLIIKSPSSIAIEEFSDEFEGEIRVEAGKYSLYRIIHDFETNCKPACDIFKRFAYHSDYLTKSLIQLVPEVSVIHEHAHDDDTQILSPPLLPQPSASLLAPVEKEDMTRKEREREWEREMENKMECEMKRKRDRKAIIDYDYAMQNRSTRKWEKEREMLREMELEREMELDREMERENEREREREREVERERNKKRRQREREREHKRERRRKKIERKRERELEREMEGGNKRMAIKRREKQEVELDIQRENKRERRRKKREMKREVTWDKMGLKLSEAKSESESERESESESESEAEIELIDNHFLLVPCSPALPPPAPTNAVPVVEEERRDKENKRAKKRRKKARRNKKQRRGVWQRCVVAFGLEGFGAAGCIFCILLFSYLFIFSR